LTLNPKHFLQTAAVILMLAFAFLQAHSQALPTASSNIRISAFAGASGNFTGLQLAKNLDFTGGVDVEFKPFAGFYPAVEVRGMYPILSGQTVSERNLLGGIRLARHKNNLAGYGDFLYGRGQVDYGNGAGLPNPSGTLLYEQTVSDVYSVGGGVDWQWTRHFGLKGDFQLQHYDSPVSPTGVLASKVFTLGIIYRLGSGSVR
jgi:hypothetical protein